MPLSRARLPRAPGSVFLIRPWKGDWCMVLRASTWGIGLVQLTHTDAEQGFLDFKRFD